jgi:hypothetical protein
MSYVSTIRSALIAAVQSTDCSPKYAAQFAAFKPALDSANWTALVPTFESTKCSAKQSALLTAIESAFSAAHYSAFCTTE